MGARPVAHGHHRFEWLYVTAFISPTTGEYFWYTSNGVSKPFFEALLATLAQESGAGRDRIIVLVLGNAGWHGQSNLKVPDEIRLLFLPPYTPKLQPAEHLWEIVDEPIINQHIADIDVLEAIVAARCVQLVNDRQTLQGRTGFHWWPKIAKASQSPGKRIIDAT